MLVWRKADVYSANGDVAIFRFVVTDGEQRRSGLWNVSSGEQWPHAVLLRVRHRAPSYANVSASFILQFLFAVS